MLQFLKFRLFIVILLLVCGSRTAVSQSFEVVGVDTINRIDTAGKKQGLWKYWDNNL